MQMKGFGAACLHWQRVQSDSDCRSVFSVRCRFPFIQFTILLFTYMCVSVYKNIFVRVHTPSFDGGVLFYFFFKGKTLTPETYSLRIGVQPRFQSQGGDGLGG